MIAAKNSPSTIRSRNVLVKSIDGLKLSYACETIQMTSFKVKSRNAAETNSNPTCLRLDQAYSESEKRATAKDPTAA